MGNPNQYSARTDMTGNKGKEQEQMYRIKILGHTSPFCYPKALAIKRAEKIIAWMDGRLKFDLIPVDEHDPMTVWKDNHPVFDPFIADQMIFLKGLEDSWQTLQTMDP